MNDTLQFSLRYDGEDLHGHEMDARELAPALIGVCDLIDEANSVINLGRARIDIRVRTLKDGSFQIDIALLQSFLDHAVDLLSGKPVTALLALAAIIGFAKGPVIGLIELIKRLRGLQPRAVKDLGEGNVQITLDDNTELTLKKETLLLYQSRRARKAAHAVAKPLERTGIDSLDVLQDGATVQTLAKDDAKYFVPTYEEVRRVTERNAKLRIHALWFSGENKWRFIEGDRQLSATIGDQRFIERVLTEDESFQPSDLLEVRLQETQVTTKDGETKCEHEVLEVLSHVKSPKQTHLEF